MSAIDTSGLLPQDILAALRSFPRRLRAALDPGRFGDGDTDARDAAAAAARAPDAHSPLLRLAEVAGLAAAAERTIATLALADDAALGGDLPTSDPARWAPSSTVDVDALLGEAERALDAVVGRLESMPSAAWAHTATTRSGAPVTAIELGRALVGVVADDLRAIDAAMQAHASAR